jgi:hypothetical protein
LEVTNFIFKKEGKSRRSEPPQASDEQQKERKWVLVRSTCDRQQKIPQREIGIQRRDERKSNTKERSRQAVKVEAQCETMRTGHAV